MKTYLKEILRKIPENVRILDLGCGSGEILAILKKERNAQVFGIEINQNDIAQCIKKNIPVVQADLDNELKNFYDDSFDFIILSETFQVIKNPEKLLQEMTRVGKKCLVNFINIGHLSNRSQLFFLGKMPISKHLPHQWYNTPNIHLGTLKDFRNLCNELNIKILSQTPINSSFPLFHNVLPNLFAKNCIFEIQK